MRLRYLLSRHWATEYQETVIGYGRKQVAASPHGVVYLVSPKPGKLNLSFEPPGKRSKTTTIMEIRNGPTPR